MVYQLQQFKKQSCLGRMSGKLMDTHSFVLIAHYQRMENQQLGMRGLVFSWMRGQRQPGRRLGKSGMLLVRLKLVGAEQRKTGGPREKKNTYLSVVRVYAPTAKAPPEIAQKFAEDLQDTVDKIPTLDVLLLLGDLCV